MIPIGGRGEAAAVASLLVGCKDGVGRGVLSGCVRGWNMMVIGSNGGSVVTVDRW